LSFAPVLGLYLYYMKKHRFNIFPEMQPEDYSRLKADLMANGYDEKQPIYTYEGEILDGWNRFRACGELGITPAIKQFFGDEIDAIQFVMRTNKRRNLTSSQWAAIAVEADEVVEAIRQAVEVERRRKQKENAANQHTEPLGNKLPEGKPHDETKAATKIAQTFNTNRTYVNEAAKLRETKPEVFEQVKRGEKTLTEVKREEIKEAQTATFEKLKEREILPTVENYDVIVIDPPWQMEKIEREVAPLQVGFDYPTMTMEEIKAFKLPAAENCHVFLWITHKHLPQGFDILQSWGAKYVCTFVWHKNGGFQPFGLPQYNCEFVLYARIGTPKFADLKNFMTCFNANRTGHSAKPEEFYAVVKRVTVGKRIDIFNRRQIDGFDTWGNQAV
jgi:N6-adenosine-specific RNA methylase IME4